MNFNSLLNLNFFEKIGTIVDIIPKVIYFVIAAITSGVDAMQALVRKLAGLDAYYQNGAQVAQKDPLTEFLYGIIGYGENASIYKALNTVFWSLAIFGVIVLVVSTMVAIIKSHYNEDTAGTSPWKYIYTAIKAVFTFVLIPVVVVIGMQLASFVLRTLDNITAGAGSEGEITEMYGGEATNIFKAEKIVGTETDSYMYYDFFGARGVSNTTTFSGMLFKAAAYSANRARIDGSRGFTLGIFTDIEDGNGRRIFARDEVLGNIQSNDEKLAFVADQVDYAFANCLTLQSGASYSEWVDATDPHAPVAGFTDLWAPGNVAAFSKWNVSTVWLFYNLWSLNFIVAFAGSFSVFSIMISIIIGMMTRLVKGAALFLVYPALLGIAPMDNFKAFKSWGTNFLQQILMAFGSIVGMNLLLLILPYVQTISFFGFAVVDYIVNVILLITGLLMAKDFISMVSGFVGGADANSIGGSMKGDISASVKKGASATAKIGLGTARVVGTGGLAAGKTLGKAGMKVGKTIAHAVGTKTAADRANKARGNKDSAKTKLDAAQEELTLNKSALEARSKALRGEKGTKAEMKLAGDEAAKKAREQGLSDAEVKKRRLAAEEAQFNKILGGDDIAKGLMKQIKGSEKGVSKADGEFKRYAGQEADIAKKYGLVREQGRDARGRFTGITYKNTKTAGDAIKGDITAGAGKIKAKAGDMAHAAGDALAGLGEDIFKGVGELASWKSVGKNIADAFTKSLDDVQQGLGIDKAIGGIKDILKPSHTTKDGIFNAKAATGDKLTEAEGKKREKEAQETQKLLKEMVEQQKAQNKKLDELKKNNGSSGSGGSSSGSST